LALRLRTCLCSTVPPPPREGRGGTFRDDEICLVRHCRGEGTGRGVGEKEGKRDREMEMVVRGGGVTTAWNARERERENVTTRRGFTEAMGAPRKHETHIIVGGGRPCAPRGGRPCTSIHGCSADIRLRATGVGRRPSFTSQVCGGWEGSGWCRMCAWCEGRKRRRRGVGGSVFLRFLSAPPNLRRSHGTPNAVRGGRLRSRTVLCPFCHKDRRVVGRAGWGEGGVGVLERAGKSGEG
jgi:hypothetical protein